MLEQPRAPVQRPVPREAPCSRGASALCRVRSAPDWLRRPTLLASSATCSQPEFQDSSLHKGKTPSYHPGPATRLSRRGGDVSSPLYFTSLEHWFESSSSMSSQRHTAAGHGDDSLSSAEAELWVSKVFPGLHRRGVLHPGG